MKSVTLQMIGAIQTQVKFLSDRLERLPVDAPRSSELKKRVSMMRYDIAKISSDFKLLLEKIKSA